MLVGELDVGVGLPGFVEGFKDGFLDRFVGALCVGGEVGGVGWGDMGCVSLLLCFRGKVGLDRSRRCVNDD